MLIQKPLGAEVIYPTGPDASGSYGSARAESALTSYDDLDLGRLKVDDDDESDSTPDASVSTP